MHSFGGPCGDIDLGYLKNINWIKLNWIECDVIASKAQEQCLPIVILCRTTEHAHSMNFYEFYNSESRILDLWSYLLVIFCILMLADQNDLI